MLLMVQIHKNSWQGPYSYKLIVFAGSVLLEKEKKKLVNLLSY